MSTATPKARPERQTQDRVAAMLTQATSTGKTKSHAAGLGYTYLGKWDKRADNQCIEEDLLKANLKKRGYRDAQIDAAVFELKKAAELGADELREVNKRTYQLLRYGVSVKIAIGQKTETVHLIDWEHPEHNDFGLAEEVTLRDGNHERRPDIVLYINGIAVVVIELKRSSVEIGDGVRQLISNQEKLFNAWFFTTAQLLMAGSDSQGLCYGTVGTTEEFFVNWRVKRDINQPLAVGELLDEPLRQLCNPMQLLDWIRYFVIFDGGVKKIPRPHQYEGIKAAQERIKKREGGVIWHTQGSGKSILMVLLAKWILEHDPQARILVVTDRVELDEQITSVFHETEVVSKDMPTLRITSRATLTQKLVDSQPRIMCALIHKFKPEDFDVPAPAVHGNFYVFVDECHRTQGGKMNKKMKHWLSSAIFIGFTGTPLLRRDKQTTEDVFGTNIHTYKYHEAVADEVVLDLLYEARNVEQRLGSRKSIDAWFKQKTKNLNKFQQSVLRKHWANLEKLMSSEERKDRVVASIIEDFTLRPRLNNDRGTALLVASSIYDACHYFRLFQNTLEFKDRCGLITSYEPSATKISKEPKNSDTRYKYETYKSLVLKNGQSTLAYEREVKEKFKKEPAHMKLLIVVSKLLTGFDAPSCTYIYLDHKLNDHNLFQAICRTNRLDGDDKKFGYIIDYKELFHYVQNSIAVYTSDELVVDAKGNDGNPKLTNWLEKSVKQLEDYREALRYMCEPVSQPKEIEQYLIYFGGDSSSEQNTVDTEHIRVAFYKATTAFIRAYATIYSQLPKAGYSQQQIQALIQEVKFFTDVKAAIKKYTGEELDIKPYEADMRYLINTYIHADDPEVLGSMDSLSLVERIVKTGINDVIAKQINAKNKLSQKAVAETIINNVRKTIIRDQLTDPRFYAQMSKLLDDLIKQKINSTEAYKEFLRKAEELVRKMSQHDVGNYPVYLKGKPEAIVIYNNLAEIAKTTFECPMTEEEKADLALQIDQAIRDHAPAWWKGDTVKEKQVLNALYPIMGRDKVATQALFEIIKNQQGYSCG